MHEFYWVMLDFHAFSEKYWKVLQNLLYEATLMFQQLITFARLRKQGLQ